MNKRAFFLRSLFAISSICCLVEGALLIAWLGCHWTHTACLSPTSQPLLQSYLTHITLKLDQLHPQFLFLAFSVAIAILIYALLTTFVILYQRRWVALFLLLSCIVLVVLQSLVGFLVVFQSENDAALDVYLEDTWSHHWNDTQIRATIEKQLSCCGLNSSSEGCASVHSTTQSDSIGVQLNTPTCKTLLQKSYRSFWVGLDVFMLVPAGLLFIECIILWFFVRLFKRYELLDRRRRAFDEVEGYRRLLIGDEDLYMAHEEPDFDSDEEEDSWKYKNKKSNIFSR